MVVNYNSYAPDWFAVRASFGMNAIFMQSKDIDTFADYLVQHQVMGVGLIPCNVVVKYFHYFFFSIFFSLFFFIAVSWLSKYICANFCVGDVQNGMQKKKGKTPT
jgi:hypothetical protein